MAKKDQIPEEALEFFRKEGSRGGKIGGKKGGKRSLDTMTAEERTERARKAAAKSVEVRAKKAAAKKKQGPNVAITKASGEVLRDARERLRAMEQGAIAQLRKLSISTDPKVAASAKRELKRRGIAPDAGTGE